MTDPTLFDAAAQRDAGMALAAANAGSDWSTHAHEVLVDYLRAHREFHVDAFWNDSGLEPPPNGGRALGPVIKRVAREELMVKTGEWRPSVRSNLTGKPVWRSLICEQAA